MRAKLIVRLLDAQGALLAWAPLWAVAKGDGCLRATHEVVLAPVEDGESATLSLHGADLHIQRREPCALVCTKGIPLVFRWDEVWRFPSDPGPLPAVTVGATAVVVPTGGMGAAAPQ
jgi:hypothetical protein